MAANDNFDPFGFMLLTLRINVQSYYGSSRSEIISPHLKRATAAYANFKNYCVLATEPLKMALVNFEIVQPFVGNFVAIV